MNPPFAQRLKYPFAIDANAGRVAEEPDYDAYIRQLIRQVLLTAPGERLARPTFGAGVRRMVFSPLSQATAAYTKTLVLEALTSSLDRFIKVEAVEVAVDESRLDITIRYFVRHTGESALLNEEVTF